MTNGDGIRAMTDEALARRLFEKFRKCTDIYCALWRAGSGIDQLAVAV